MKLIFEIIYSSQCKIRFKTFYRIFFFFKLQIQTMLQINMLVNCPK